MEKKALMMNKKDNVATVLAKVKKGEKVSVIYSDGEVVQTIVAVQDNRFGFKISLAEIAAGEMVIKYGSKIGLCYKDIKKGEMVHIQNIESDRIGIPRERIDSMIKSMGI